MTAVDNDSTRFHVGTIVFKVFGKVEHQGKVVGFDAVNKLYHIVYDDDDTEEYYHNKVRDQRKRSLSKRRQWMKPKSAKIHYLHSKYAPKESDYVEHVMALTVETIQSIASLRSNIDTWDRDTTRVFMAMDTSKHTSTIIMVVFNTFEIDDVGK